MTSPPTAARLVPPPALPIRVMLVDDSAVVRGLINRMLTAEAGIAIVASVCDGAQAVAQLRRDPAIEVIVLDVEMPVMDGLTALKALLAIDPTVQVIMASTLTQRNAEISLQAIAAGATDYVPKPTTDRLGGADAFRRELVAKVRALGARRRQVRPLPTEGGRTTPDRTMAGRPASGVARPAPTASGRGGFALRAAGGLRPDVVAIGCSTGGPQALAQLFKDLAPGAIRQPVIITQHMPPTFTAILAEHLGRATGWTCREAEDGEPLAAGRIYVAPGDRHMRIEGGGRTAPTVRLTQDPPVNFCRPSVDPMLLSATEAFGGRLLAVILTGMGSDGVAGARAVVEAGGTVIAQDEATSVVWGMPGAVAQAGLCSHVLPLAALAPTIIKLAGGATP
jgi:two-component system chemotaxis response regulator CheB